VIEAASPYYCHYFQTPMPDQFTGKVRQVYEKTKRKATVSVCLMVPDRAGIGTFSMAHNEIGDFSTLPQTGH